MAVASLLPAAVELAERAYDFEFFQAVRLLALCYPDRAPVGGAGDPAAEVARFAVRPSLAFPPSEIREIALEDDRPPRMEVQFFGLIGPLGVLPTHYTAHILERLSARDRTSRDFLDLFHHRLVSLFYRAWEKYRFLVRYERGEPDRFSHYLLDFIGLGTPGLQDRQAVPDQALRFYAGLLAQQPRSAAAFGQILSDYFGVEVEVVQFSGAWRPLDPGSWSFLNDEGRSTEQLGVGVIVGDEVWDPQSVVMLRLGPLTLRQYREFLPNGSAYGSLVSFARFFCGDDLDVEVQLVLQRDEAPRCGLDTGEPIGPELGWTTWMFSQPLGRDPDDTVLALWRL